MNCLTRFLRRITFIHTLLFTAGCAVLLAGCAAQAPDVLASYSRVGGFANLDDSLTVHRDGRVVVTRRNGQCEFVLDRSELKRLEETLDAADLAGLDSQYLPDAAGADLMEYAVTYNGRTVSAADTAVPDQLWPVLELLNQMIAAC